MTSQKFVFTLNNYSEANKISLRLIECRYIVFGEEIAPSTGTPHLQGVVFFSTKKSHKQVCSLIPGCWCEAAKCVDEAITYAKKDGKFEEYGDEPMSRKKKGSCEKERWESARCSAMKGDIEDIDADIYIRYYSTLRKIAVDHLITPPDLDHLENRWIHGPSGCGKSRGVRTEYPDAYNKDPKTRWWDGYSGQETVVIDDLDVYDKGIGGDLKRWVDHYPFPAQMKGSSVVIRPKRVIVTSQYTPQEIWEDQKTVEALHRRFRVEGPPLQPGVFGFVFPK